MANGRNGSIRARPEVVKRHADDMYCRDHIQHLSAPSAPGVTAYTRTGNSLERHASVCLAFQLCDDVRIL